MNELSQAARWLFILALFLIAVAYFAGFTADTKAVVAGVNSLGLTFTGRNAAGNFANYPNGNPAAATTTAIPATGSLALPHPTNAPL
jgi:hypothetical protein